MAGLYGFTTSFHAVSQPNCVEDIITTEVIVTPSSSTVHS